MSKLTFVDLPANVQEMVLSSVYAINKKNGYIDHTAGPSAVAQAIALMEYGSVDVAVDPAKPDAEETVTMQAEPTGDNPEYADPEIFDPKEADDAMDALAYFFENILRLKRPEKHCGRPECKACNELFGELKVDEQSNKQRFVQVFHQDGVFGPVDIYQSRTNSKVYALMNNGRTALIESDNITQMPYQAAVEIVRVHGKVDRSIVG
ncbi:exonuclease [Kosakonia phage Kc283]|uniref:Exonuclease n=1 Tax=Kosakonia phage Kc283 TaxID=2863195 RepID=A0AAE7WGJ1_9CAUD|nr:exonuclease [Kosakonia phage Kc283]QYN79831.1 exonuclease [Kosakonia phage Kc283]